LRPTSRWNDGKLAEFGDRNYSVIRTESKMAHNFGLFYFFKMKIDNKLCFGLVLDEETCKILGNNIEVVGL